MAAAAQESSNAGTGGEADKAPEQGNASSSKKSTPTAYVILQQDEKKAWTVVGEQATTSGRAGAREAHVKALPEGKRAGVFKAVAKSSWQGEAKKYVEASVVQLASEDVED